MYLLHLPSVQIAGDIQEFIVQEIDKLPLLIGTQGTARDHCWSEYYFEFLHTHSISTYYIVSILLTALFTCSLMTSGKVSPVSGKRDFSFRKLPAELWEFV